MAMEPDYKQAYMDLVTRVIGLHSEHVLEQYGLSKMASKEIVSDLTGIDKETVDQFQKRRDANLVKSFEDSERDLYAVLLMQAGQVDSKEAYKAADEFIAKKQGAKSK